TDQQRDRDEHRQQQLLAVTQQQLQLQAELRGQHLRHRGGPRVGRESTCGEMALGGHVRNSRPVSSRNTSSRLRCSTRRSVASTLIWAHQAVTVASTCGSTDPSTKYSPGVASEAW